MMMIRLEFDHEFPPHRAKFMIILNNKLQRTVRIQSSFPFSYLIDYLGGGSFLYIGIAVTVALIVFVLYFLLDK